MASEFKPGMGLVQRPTQNQTLILTQKMQQVISLLPLSTLELSQRIQEELAENPMLEEMEPVEGGEDSVSDQKDDDLVDGSSDASTESLEDPFKKEADWDDYLSGSHSGRTPRSYEEKTPAPFENTFSAKTDLPSHLMWQINMSTVDDERRAIAAYIVGNLDENGYLDIPLTEISEALRCPEEKVEETLHLVQNLDPVGVAARDMRECLLIQARFQNLQGTIVEKIITKHLGDLEYKRYDLIAKRLGVPVEEVIDAVAVIQGMEPKPARNYSTEEASYITPDIYVVKVGGEYEIVQNNDGMPRLRVSPYYKDVLSRKDASAKDAKIYIRQKEAAAKWLIYGIEQRQKTIHKVMKCICRFQRDFLDHGVTQLKPMVLRNVAEEIGMHESTVSRATTNKWVHTPQGIFELKFFFNSPINTTDGESIASESVKEQIRKIVKSENARKPYSDQEIAEMLNKMGIDAARRTVAKYRETMGILTSRHRKQRC
jgi:RNA polymerase sigma-54 factor